MVLVLQVKMASGRKGTAKLNELLEIEQRVQQKWDRQKVFQKDAKPTTKYVSQSILLFLMYLTFCIT